MGNSQAVRILIVDDEADLREILQGQLETLHVESPNSKSGIDIHHASDGKEALAKTESMWFDAILTDINMPEMTGIELLAALRAKGSDVPVVILTGFGDKAKALDALRLGCYAFLDKPWNADYLRRVMQGGIEQGVALRKRTMQTGQGALSLSTESRPGPISRMWKSFFDSGEASMRSEAFAALADDAKKKAV